MTLDELPGELENVLRCARAVLDREITAAKTVVAAANAEKSSVQNALVDLRAQHKEVQDRLKITTAELHKAEGLAGVGHDIAKARKELARLKTETAREEKALAALAKERAAAEAQLVGLRNEAQRQIAIRTEGEAVMADIKMKLQQVQLGVRL